MSSSEDGIPDPATFLGFHAIAAARGDGLDPRLAEALLKSGSVSGAPAPSGQSQDNVVRPDFSRGRAKGKRDAARSS